MLKRPDLIYSFYQAMHPSFFPEVFQDFSIFKPGYNRLYCIRVSKNTLCSTGFHITAGMFKKVTWELQSRKDIIELSG